MTSAVAAATRRHFGMPPEWALIAFLWVTYVLNHADRQVAYTLFPALQKEFGYSDAVLGLAGALFLWIYGFCSPVAGILGDRVSKSKLVVASLAIWSFFTVLSGLAPNGGSLLACRALLGISESFFMPAAYGLMANAHGPSTRSRAIAIFGSSQMVGVAIGGSFSGMIAESLHWRAAFLILGCLGLAYAYPLWRFLRTVPPHFSETNAADRASLRSFVVLGRIPSLRIITVIVAVATFSLYLVYTWLPTFLYDKFNLGMARAGVEAGLYPQIGTVVGLFAGGFMADRLYQRTHAARFWIILAAFTFGGPCIYLVGAGSTLDATRLAAMAFGATAGLIASNQAAAAFDVVPASQRATTVGILNLLGSLVSGFGPFLGGLARRTIGIGTLMAYTSGGYLLTGGLLLFAIFRYFARDHKAAQERPAA